MSNPGIAELTSNVAQPELPVPPAQRPARQELMVKAAVVAITVLACLVILEIGLRVVDRYPMDSAGGYHEQGGLSYVLKKNLTKKVVWPTMTFTVHTSDLGFRAKEPGKQLIGGRPYDVVLGASDSFGNGLDYEQTFVGIFAENMRRHNVDVINMSVAGHHLLEQAALFKDFASSTTNHPRAVLIVFNPNLIGGFDDNHTNVVVRRGDLFDKETWRVALLRKTLANSSTVYCFIRDAVRKIQQRLVGREDFELSFYIERFSSRHSIKEPERSEAFLRHLNDLTQYIRSLGAEPICVYCPPAGGFLLNDLAAKGKLDPALIDTAFFADIVKRHCDAQNVRFINLEPPVQQRYDKGEKLNFDADGHYNAPTSRLVGEYLYSVLKPNDESSRD